MQQPFEVFNPWELADNIHFWAASANVDYYLRLLAYGVIAVFFLMNMYRALLTGSSAEVVDALIRAAIAGLLVQNSWVFTNLAVYFFKFLASLGNHAMATLGDWQQVDQVREKIFEARGLILQSMRNYGWVDFFLKFGEVIAASFIGALISIAFAVFFILTMAAYNFMVFMAVVTLTIAVILAPIVFACAISRFLQAFIWEWLQVILHAALVIMLAQVLIGLVIRAGVLDPLNTYVDQLRQAVQAGPGTPSILAVPISAIMALVVGFFALLNVQGIASSFVGRVESVAGATVAAVAAMRMAHTAAPYAVRAAARMGQLVGGAMESAHELIRRRFHSTTPPEPESPGTSGTSSVTDQFLGQFDHGTGGSLDMSQVADDGSPAS